MFSNLIIKYGKLSNLIIKYGKLALYIFYSQINKMDVDTYIELMRAVRSNNVDLVSEMLDEYKSKGGDLKFLFEENCGHNYYMPLVHKVKDVEMGGLLYMHGANFERIYDGAAPLVDVVFCRNTDLVTFLINTIGVDCHKRCVLAHSYRHTLLGMAIMNGNLEICKLFYLKGCSTFEVIKEGDRNTLLHSVVLAESESMRHILGSPPPLKRQTEIVRWVLSLKHEDLKLFSKNAYGNTALELARYVPTQNLIKTRIVSETLLVLRSTLYCPRLSKTKKLAKLMPDHFRLVASFLL